MSERQLRAHSHEPSARFSSPVEARLFPCRGLSRETTIADSWYQCEAGLSDDLMAVVELFVDSESLLGVEIYRNADHAVRIAVLVFAVSAYGAN